jgi:hypothetical protein
MQRLVQLSKLLIAFCLVALVLSSCKDNPSTTPPTQANTLSGVARDEQGYIVPNAWLEVVNPSNTVVASDTTDEFGIFQLSNLPSETDLLKVRVYHRDFKSYEAPIKTLTSGNISNGALVTMTHLDSACARLSITVSSQATNAPIEGAQVRLTRNETLVTTVNTDQIGKVSFNYLMAGNYFIKVTKPGYLIYTRTLTVQYCDTMSLDIRLEAGSVGDSCCFGKLRIIPKDTASNTVMIGATVKLTGPQTQIRTKTAGQDGVLFEEMCPGQYAVRVSKEGYAVKEFTVTMGCNDLKEETVYLHSAPVDSCCNGKIRIIPQAVINNTTQTLVGASVKISKTGMDSRIYTAGQDGVLFTALCPGTYAFRISKDGYVVQEFTVTQGCDQIQEITKTLAAVTVDSCCNGKIRVIPQVKVNNVLQPLVGATVKLTKTGMDAKSYTSTQDGVLFTGLCPGTYGIRISKDGYVVQEFTVTQGCDQVQEITKELTATPVDSCCNGKIRVIPQVKVNNVLQTLVGATVKLTKTGMDAKSYTSGQDGVLFTGLCPGTYGVRISKEGYVVQEFTVTQGCDQIQEITKELTASQVDSCCLGSITVVVRDSATSNVLQNVAVKLWRASTLLATQSTGTNGSTTFTNRCQGQFALNLLRDGYRGLEYGFTLGCNEQKTIELTLAPPYPCNTAMLKLRVKDSTVVEGGWLADATVILRKWVNNAWVDIDTALTNSEGWYAASGLTTPAQYQATVSKSGYLTRTYTFSLTECKTYSETIRLPK